MGILGLRNLSFVRHRINSLMVTRWQGFGGANKTCDHQHVIKAVGGVYIW